MKITVIGSSNIDMCSRVEHLPAPGETIGNGVFMQVFGGKGANQAVAAARLGGDVCFVTSLGGDPLAEEIITQLKKEQIDVSAIHRERSTSTGIALIMIDSHGENCIAVNPGANAALKPSCIEVFKQPIEDASIIVMQAEIPYETVKYAAKIAHRAGVPVLYNPAPVCDVDDEMMSMVDILVVNRSESAALSGEQDPLRAAEILHSRGARYVVVTLGSEGAILYDGSEVIRVPAFKVNVIDAVGAGDTFCGALAVAYADKQHIDRESLLFASAAAAISVTRQGAQPSIPTGAEVRAFIESYN